MSGTFLPCGAPARRRAPPWAAAAPGRRCPGTKPLPVGRQGGRGGGEAEGSLNPPVPQFPHQPLPSSTPVACGRWSLPATHPGPAALAGGHRRRCTARGLLHGEAQLLLVLQVRGLGEGTGPVRDPRHRCPHHGLDQPREGPHPAWRSTRFSPNLGGAQPQNGPDIAQRRASSCTTHTQGTSRHGGAQHPPSQAGAGCPAAAGHRD